MGFSLYMYAGIVLFTSFPMFNSGEESNGAPSANYLVCCDIVLSSLLICTEGELEKAF